MILRRDEHRAFCPIFPVRIVFVPNPKFLRSQSKIYGKRAAWNTWIMHLQCYEYGRIRIYFEQLLRSFPEQIAMSFSFSLKVGFLVGIYRVRRCDWRVSLAHYFIAFWLCCLFCICITTTVSYLCLKVHKFHHEGLWNYDFRYRHPGYYYLRLFPTNPNDRCQ